MSRGKLVLVSLLLVAACSGNPLLPDEPVNPGDLPGTDNPSASDGIQRYEARDESNGNGYAQTVSYDRVNDTFSVDNLGFDGNNAYKRSTAKRNLGPFAVYEGNQVYRDDVTGQPIGQFEHRAVHGVSKTGRTEFSIIRTGSYVPYGFGGFVYQRNDGVNLPSAGQAAYTGNYGGLRDFDGHAGIEYASGKMQMAIDFNDFNDGAAVQGLVYDRKIFDVNGTDITASVLQDMSDKSGATQSSLPVITFAVGPGAIDGNGEISGSAGSYITNGEGQTESFEAGKYYAVISGDNADEVAGVIVIEADDPSVSGATVRETGGFILYRPIP